MASGRLAAAALAATTNTSLYTVPSSTVVTVTVSLCNISSGDLTVRLALAASGTPADGEYIEYGATIPPGGVLERSGLVLDATKRVVAYASATGINAVVWGVEEAA